MAASAQSTKPDGYYALGRADVVAELPAPMGRVLDVGCGEGGTARALRARGAEAVWGVEPEPQAAERAGATLDGVVSDTIEEALASRALEGPFDTICCYDVLEHLVDPGRVLRGLSNLASRGARLHVSVPNARHFSLLADLALRGTFGYTEWGHRDETHLRWFTRRDIVALLEDNAWQVRWWRPNVFRGSDRTADRVTFGLAREFIALQWHVLAERASG
jgi:2-polyprenyl-3-methyl-5-hydroxy-6-metoxy-1,4-benzoquinol methylase